MMLTLGMLCFPIMSLAGGPAAGAQTEHVARAVSVAPAAPVPAAPLAVSILDKPLQVFDAAMLATLPRQTLRAGVHDQPAKAWSGVSLAELLRKAGAPSGKTLRGKAMAMVVRVIGSDGYVVVFSLGELDADFGKRDVLLADRHDGQPLGADGPLRLVVSGDAHGARWVRNVERIEVVSAAP
jgi:hypothetical protein